MTFGEYFKSKRIGLRITLRCFCIEHGLDSVYISKLERGRLSAPYDLSGFIEYLGLNADETVVFRELAAKSRLVPPGDISESELAKRLPVVFGVASREVIERDLRSLAEFIRESENSE